MAKATECTQNIMSERLCSEYIDKIDKKSKNSDKNACILYTGRTKSTGYGMIDFKHPEKKRFIPMHVHPLRYMIECKSLKLEPTE